MMPWKLVLIGFCFMGAWTNVKGQPKNQNFSLAKCQVNLRSDDLNLREKYFSYVNSSIGNAELFFGEKFKNVFVVQVHPNRNSLDSTWQKDWNMPDFKSECWMVASGIATKLDLLSLQKWNSEACEHQAEDSISTQMLIAHEVIHVYHGQHHASPDFSTAEGIDWFVEGLATFASGQYNEKRKSDLMNHFKSNPLPTSLEQFWKGKMKYGLAGSLVAYLDAKYGRKKIASLLAFDKKNQILNALNISENKLIADWKLALGL